MRKYLENIMTSKKCKKCHTQLSQQAEKDACPNCGEKPSKSKKIMAWFCIIILLVAGMMWAFTDSEPDVTVVPTPQIEGS